MHRNTLPLLATVAGCGLLAAPAADGTTRSHDYARLPMHFEQVSDTGRYRARGQGYQVRLSSASVDLGLHYANENGKPRRSDYACCPLQPNRYGTSYDAFLVRFDGFTTLPAITP